MIVPEAAATDIEREALSILVPLGLSRHISNPMRGRNLNHTIIHLLSMVSRSFTDSHKALEKSLIGVESEARMVQEFFAGRCRCP